MKTLSISLGLMLIVSTGFAQLALENVINEKVNVLQLENGEIKYVKYQDKGKILNILNLDHSIWKTVELPLQKGQYLDEVKSISSNIFNKDDLIEILYTSKVYNYSLDTENPFNQGDNINFTLNIINEKGEFLLKEERIKDYAIIESQGSKKLYVYKNLDIGVYTKIHTIIYAISE